MYTRINLMWCVPGDKKASVHSNNDPCFIQASFILKCLPMRGNKTFVGGGGLGVVFHLLPELIIYAC